MILRDDPAFPAVVKIGYRTIRVIKWDFRDAVAARNFGEYHRHPGTILVDESLEGDQARETFLHELLHAIYGVWPLPTQPPTLTEETIVATMAAGLATVLRDNPAVARWLIDFPT